MPNSKDVFKWVLNQIALDEPIDEINSIVYLLMENEFGVTRSQITASVDLNQFNNEDLLPLINRVNSGEPIQYIIGSQEFFGRSFIVNPSVLIPRPETEQLVSVILDYTNKHKLKKISILDVGTGSGCIPITLQLENSDFDGVGIDISKSAIACAIKNNNIHHTTIQFETADVLNDPLPTGPFNAIVSNPPYVTEKEKLSMKVNVLNYEPHLALFVPDSDPLRFYKAIASKSQMRLEKGGLLAFEINEKYGAMVHDLLKDFGYQSIKIIKDTDDKDRFVSALNI